MRKRKVYFGLSRKDWVRNFKVVANGTMITIVDRIARQRDINQVTLMGIMSDLLSNYRLLDSDYTAARSGDQLTDAELNQWVRDSQMGNVPELRITGAFFIFGLWFYEVEPADPGLEGSTVIRFNSEFTNQWLMPPPEKPTAQEYVEMVMISVLLLDSRLNMDHQTAVTNKAMEVLREPASA